jgi:predicted ester cyclase
VPGSTTRTEGAPVIIDDARKQLIRRFYDEAWSRGDFAVTDELFAGDYTAPLPGSPPGAEGERRHVAMIRAVLPDLKVTIDDLVGEGETVVARVSIHGTDRGGFLGRPPTGRRVTYWGVTFFRFTGDRISACWAGADMLGLMIQLGVLPSPWPEEEPDTASHG